MDRFTEMRVFVAVAEAESFVGATRKLGMSPPAVSRCIANLEARLGVKLLDRTTRHVRVTESGQRYLHDARRILAEVDAADDAVVGINATPRGQLSITAPVLFGKIYIIPVIVEFLQRYPLMEVNAVFLDRLVNLMEEGIDVGVRIGELPDSSFKAIRVGTVRRMLCAAPSYLAQHGAPTAPAELAQHTLIAATGAGSPSEWKFRADSRETAVRIQPRLVVTTNDAAIEAAVGGLGIARLLSYQVAPQLAAGQLQAVLSGHVPAAIPIHVVHRESRQGAARVRSFIDLVVARLRENVALADPDQEI